VLLPPVSHGALALKYYIREYYISKFYIIIRELGPHLGPQPLALGRRALRSRLPGGAGADSAAGAACLTCARTHWRRAATAGLLVEFALWIDLHSEYITESRNARGGEGAESRWLHQSKKYSHNCLFLSLFFRHLLLRLYFFEGALSWNAVKCITINSNSYACVKRSGSSGNSTRSTAYSRLARYLDSAMERGSFLGHGDAGIRPISLHATINTFVANILVLLVWGRKRCSRCSRWCAMGSNISGGSAFTRSARIMGQKDKRKRCVILAYLIPAFRGLGRHIHRRKWIRQARYPITRMYVILIAQLQSLKNPCANEDIRYGRLSTSRGFLSYLWRHLFSVVDVLPTSSRSETGPVSSWRGARLIA